MTGNKQKVGAIRSSKRVAVSQTAEDLADQEVGDIENSEDVNLRQQVAQTFPGAYIHFGEWMAALDQRERAALVPRIREIILSEATDVQISADDLNNAANNTLPSDIGESHVGKLVKDAAAAVSLVAGGLAISAIAEPFLLAFAVPSALVLTGVLQKDRLRGLYDRIIRLRK